MRKYIFYFLVLMLFGLYINFQSSEEVEVQSDKNKYKLVSVGFWNVENLFDTIDDPKKFDEDFTPNSSLKWNKERFNLKIERLATVISKIGSDKTKRPPAVFGLCEVENREVIDELINHPLLKPYNYKIVHRNSPDSRGIDVAMIYRADVFELINYQYKEVLLKDKTGKTRRTRDILTAKGKIEDEIFFFAFNHWPSRRGGEKRSIPGRISAAKVLKSYTDSLVLVENNPKILIMGDFNDDPIDTSIANTLDACPNAKNTTNADCQLINLSYDLYKKGVGTLAYRDNWNLFDQAIVSKHALDGDNGFFAFSKHVYNEKFLINSSGRFKGYPFRTYVGDVYQAGYADHFPIYILLAKKI